MRARKDNRRREAAPPVPHDDKNPTVDGGDEPADLAEAALGITPEQLERYEDVILRLFDGSYFTVDEEGKVSGSYYSDRDGAKYQVAGKLGPQPHAIEFVIKLPRVEHTFKGLLFTGNGKALAGTSKMTDRESAFYAVREE